MRLRPADSFTNTLVESKRVLLTVMSEEEALDVMRLNPAVLLEASGNVSPERIRGMAQRGLDIDVVSSGGLIHQARWIDLGLDMLDAGQ